MRRTRVIPVVPDRIIKVGGLYRDTARCTLVTAEDHQILQGRRTGRIVVSAADGRERFPGRWLCEAADLEECPDLAMPIHPSDQERP